MAGLFDTEGKFYGALSLATDLVIVNILMLITSLPVATGGAAVRAATVVIRGLLNDACSTPARTYLREFSRNGKTATIWWLMSLGLCLLAGYEFYVVANAGITGAVRTVLYASVLSGLFVVVAVSVWLYPCAHYGGLKLVFKRAVMMAFANPVHTVAAVFVAASPVLVFMFGAGHLGFVLTFYALIGGALTQYLIVLIIQGKLPPVHASR